MPDAPLTPSPATHAAPPAAFGLRAARLVAGLTAELVARRAGYSPAYVLQIERDYLRAAAGDTSIVLPPLPTAERLAAALRSDAFPTGATADVFYQFSPIRDAERPETPPLRARSGVTSRVSRGAHGPGGGNRRGHTPTRRKTL